MPDSASSADSKQAIIESDDVPVRLAYVNLLTTDRLLRKLLTPLEHWLRKPTSNTAEATLPRAAVVDRKEQRRVTGLQPC